MADITIVNGVYKPTNKTGGHHPVASGKRLQFANLKIAIEFSLIYQKKMVISIVRFGSRWIKKIRIVSHWRQTKHVSQILCSYLICFFQMLYHDVPWSKVELCMYPYWGRVISSGIGNDVPRMGKHKGSHVPGPRHTYGYTITSTTGTHIKVEKTCTYVYIYTHIYLYIYLLIYIYVYIYLYICAWVKTYQS
jgi:hypothetical protein